MNGLSIMETSSLIMEFTSNIFGLATSQVDPVSKNKSRISLPSLMLVKLSTLLSTCEAMWNLQVLMKSILE